MGNVCFRKESCPKVSVDTPLGPFSLDSVLTFNQEGIADSEKAKRDLQEIYYSDYRLFRKIMITEGYNDAKKGSIRKSFPIRPERKRLYSLGYDYGSSHKTLEGPKGRLPREPSALELGTSSRDYDLSFPEQNTP
jgi:hypothetical protein